MNTVTISEKGTQKKRVMTTSGLLEDFLRTNELVYYKSKQKDFAIFLLPYRTFDDTKIDIRIVTYDNKKICRMTFDAKLNKKKDYSKELLRLNSELINGGTLSVAENSDTVTFSVNFLLQYKTYLKQIYDQNLSLCFYVLNKLINLNIIKREVVLNGNP